MLKLKVLIKLLKSRSSTTQQGLCRAELCFAEGDIWDMRGFVSGKQSREHQPHGPRLNNPACKSVHHSALQANIHQDMDKLKPCRVQGGIVGWGSGIFHI